MCVCPHRIRCGVDGWRKRNDGKEQARASRILFCFLTQVSVRDNIEGLAPETEKQIGRDGGDMSGDSVRVLADERLNRVETGVCSVRIEYVKSRTVVESPHFSRLSKVTSNEAIRWIWEQMKENQVEISERGVVFKVGTKESA